ncbi:hypothetical protein [Kitasatospora sp. NPDC085464]|uniref:hypothetical protein n=1 Tax=Kitasatospora sp. NPDC085464 TaxID=3364063 RepID=UPI0037C9EA8B
MTSTPADIDGVLTALRQQAMALDTVDRPAAAHLHEQFLPQVSIYARALLRAGYPASVFFSRDFTNDTGQIVNQGRAEPCSGA